MANDDLNDLEEDGRGSVRSASISKIAGFRLESPTVRLVAGMAMVGAEASAWNAERYASPEKLCLDFGLGLASVSLAPVEPCLGLRPECVTLPSSENSEESSYPLMIPSQVLQTRKEPDWSKRDPGRSVVHLESNIWPQVLQ